MNSKIKRIFSTLFLTFILMISISIGTSLSANSSIVLQVDDVSIVDDDSVVGSVSIVGDVVDLAAFQFSLSWDPSVVTVVDVEVSEGLGSVNYFVDTEDGVLNVNWFDVSGVSGDFFYVVNVTFQRASSAVDGDMSILSFSNDMLADISGDIFEYSLETGVVTISDEEPTNDVVLHVDDVSIVDDDSVVGSVSIVGDVVDLAAFQFSLSWDPSVVTVVDVETSESFSSMNYYLDEDVLNVSWIDIDENTAVLNVTWFDVNGVSGDFFYVVNVTFQRASSAVDGDMSILSFSNDLLADADLNSIDHGADDGVASISDTDSDDVVLQINDVTIIDDESAMGSVSIVGDVTNIAALQFNLSYDSSVVQISDIDPIGDLGEVNFYDTDGVLNVNWLDVNGVSGDFFYVVNVTFQRNSTAVDGDMSILSFSNDLLADADLNTIDHGVDNGLVTISIGSSPGDDDDDDVPGDDDDDDVPGDDDDDGGTGGGNTNPGTSGDSGTTVQNNNPHAVMNLSTDTALAGETITFDASQSSDPDGDSLTYLWDFDDGTTSFEEITYHSYQTNSVQQLFEVKLTVSDGNGGQDTVTKVIYVSKGNSPPSKPQITGPTTGEKNSDISFGIVSTDSDNDTIKYAIDWGDDTTFNSDFQMSGEELSITHTWNQPGKYTLEVIATDNQTLSATEQHILYIDSIQVGSIGVLIDEDGDGYYDSFSSESSTEKYPVKRNDNETYLIDMNNDSIWDYSFNTETNELLSYETDADDTDDADSTGNGDSLGLIILIILVVIVLILVAYLSSKKEPKKDSRKEKNDKPKKKKK